MTLVSIAQRLEGELAGRARILAPGPGHSRHDRSLSVLIDPLAPDGFRVHSFAGDPWQECRDHVRERLGRCSEPRPRDREHQHPSAVAGSSSTKDSAQRLWNDARPIGSTLGEHYLHARGIVVSDAVLDGSALRFHPACPFRLEGGELVRLPAMVAAMLDIRTGEFRGVHRTALQPNGSGKADLPGLGKPKKMLGSAKGACVKLSPDECVTTGLHIAEGIETALACMMMGFAPTWAALSAGGIAAFPVLPGVEALTVFADHDAGGTGLDAARACARRWIDAGCEVRIRTPPQTSSDWADDGEDAP